MRVRIIDAFTDRPFGGNPAGVILLDSGEWPQGQWMRDVAVELNLPMTAFAHPLPAGSEADWALRWFNPVIEEKLCGHATLATAHALHEDRGAAGTVRFSTASGVLAAHTDDDGRVTLDFPIAPVTECAVPEGLAKALGIEPESAHRAARLTDILLELADEATVRSLSPDFGLLGEIGVRDEIRGIVATARASDPDGGYDFVSRYFSPHQGLDEDSATGSSHTALAPYWSERLGRDPLTGYQASARGGLIGTRIRGDRVELTGRAVTVLDGTLFATSS